MNDKVIAITGASSGIGEATALRLSAQGAKLVLGARRTERLEALASTLGDAVSVRTDVTRRDDLRRLVETARDRFGRLDVLVSNAGLGPVAPLDDLGADDWDAMVDVNVKGLLHGIAEALPVFRAQGSGHFVNVASTAAFRIVPGMAVYSGTKAAVRNISEGLRQEAGHALRVTLISPGMVNTDFADAAGPEIRARMNAMGEKAIGPDAIADAIAYAINQPPTVEIGEIVIRPTVQA